MKVPSTGDSVKYIANGKGVPREEESEESRWQISGLTNRNPIRHSLVDEVATQTEVQMLYGTGGCKWGRWMEGKKVFLPEEVLQMSLGYQRQGWRKP
nr:hypothetical protein [uncultured Sphaerochaeta sp.]